jgi:CelD/BcsL family acetyltransferase involved in cellulose biosynthesis
MMRTVKSYGIKIRNLEFQNIPDTQNCNILADPAQRQDVITAMMNYLQSSAIGWDRMELRKLESTSDVVDAVTHRAKQASLSFGIAADSTNPGIALDQTWDEFYSRRSRRLKKANNHLANRLKKSGKNISIHHYQASALSPDEMSSVLATITNISSRSWKRTTGLTLDESGPSAFICRLTEHAHKHGWASIWVLKIDDRPVAMEYQLIYDGTVAALRADYDSRFEELSPGSYLNWQMLASLFNSGFRHYSMGPGENTYKFRWAEVTPDHSRLTVYNNTLRGKMIRLLDLRLRPRVVRLMDMVRRDAEGNSSE